MICGWFDKRRSNSLPDLLIDCSPDLFPPLDSYYDFIYRLWLQDKQLQKLGWKDLLPAEKQKVYQ